MSIYKTLLLCADKGRSFKIDLNTKDLWIGKKHYIEKGVSKVEDELINKDDLKNVFGVDIDLSIDTWNVIKYLYQEYKHSVPNSRWKDNAYFKALDVAELTDDELAFNISRKFGEAMLTGYILLGGLMDWIEWKNDNHWFYQDDEDEDLIILKQWVK